MDKLGNPNLECYISRARLIVIEVRSFERIDYLIVKQSLRPKHKNLVRRERKRERSWRGKERLKQPMVVITLLTLI